MFVGICASWLSAFAARLCLFCSIFGTCFRFGSFVVLVAVVTSVAVAASVAVLLLLLAVAFGLFLSAFTAAVVASAVTVATSSAVTFFGQFVFRSLAEFGRKLNFLNFLFKQFFYLFEVGYVGFVDKGDGNTVAVARAVRPMRCT